jgi:hypothetical protein
MVLKRVGHLLAADEPCTGDDAPQVRAWRVIAVLVRGQDILDLHRVKPDRLDRLPFALEGEPGVGFDQDQAVRGLDEPLATQVAFDPASGQLPDARRDG